MTTTRETIARAIYNWSGGDVHEATDAVLRALDEAGLVVVEKEPSEAMVLAGLGKVEIDWYCAGRRDDGDYCETDFQSGCLPDVYRAMIAASQSSASGS